MTKGLKLTSEYKNSSLFFALSVFTTLAECSPGVSVNIVVDTYM
jgi:hypothetical protein